MENNLALANIIDAWIMSQETCSQMRKTLPCLVVSPKYWALLQRYFSNLKLLLTLSEHRDLSPPFTNAPFIFIFDSTVPLGVITS